MNEFQGTVGYFYTADALRAAVDRAQAAHFRGMIAYLPFADQPTVDTLDSQTSPVRWVALAGGIAGIVTALTMTIWMSWDYPLMVGGKPITSLPPFLVIAFELMVLFGSLAAIAGFFWWARLPDLTPSDAYHPRLVVDRFALFVPRQTNSPADEVNSNGDRRRVERMLREAGTIEIRRVYRTKRSRLQAVQ